MKILSQLFYPNLCRSCDNRPPIKDRLFCTHCLCKLPFADIDAPHDNSFTRHFWGRLPVKYGLSLFYYVQNGPVPRLIKALKYNGQSILGKKLGREFGVLLKNSPFLNEIDLIIPVPIHPKKLKIRGYNQALVIAEGMAEELCIPINAECLIRSNFNASQTLKTRNERVIDLGKSFTLASPDISGKHVLLVDDVLTTGATLEACGLELLKADNIEISLATLAQGLPNG